MVNGTLQASTFASDMCTFVVETLYCQAIGYSVDTVEFCSFWLVVSALGSFLAARATFKC